MHDFEYAQPETEWQALELLADDPTETEVMGGGSDLVGLLKKMVVRPRRVVNLAEIESMRCVERDEASGDLVIGASTRLDEILDSPLAAEYPAVQMAIRDVGAMQWQCGHTLGGELFRRPRCWYFRGGEGLLADRGRIVTEGDNRYHAILGNEGPAKFVSASLLAPILISLAAQARVLGPKSSDERFVPLEQLYRAPKRESQRELTLTPGQFVSHVLLPPPAGRLSASYEIRQGAGPDDPMAAAAVNLTVKLGAVREAHVLLGQVAPTPWRSREAEEALLGRPVDAASAAAAGRAAVKPARPLSHNEYKVELTRAAVERAVLRAAGLPTGGFE